MWRRLTARLYRESRDVWGSRPNRNSKAVILNISDEFGRLRLIELAGAKYSSQRSGQALQSSASLTKSLYCALTAGVIGGSEVESGFQPVAEGFQYF